MMAIALLCASIAALTAVLAAAIRGVDPETLAIREDDDEMAPFADVAERLLGAVHQLRAASVLAFGAAVFLLARPVVTVGPALVAAVVASTGGVLVGIFVPDRVVRGRETAVLGRALRIVLELATVFRVLTVVPYGLARAFAGGDRTDDAETPDEHRPVPGEMPARPLDTVLSLSQSEVGEVMTPRPEMVTVAVDATVADVRELVAASRHGRYPVCGSSIDEVLGVVDIRDLIGIDDAATAIADFVREMPVVPETTPAWELLGSMQATDEPMALVVDEFGTVSGVVTYADLAAEITGKVTEAGDPDIPDYEQLDVHVWDLSGSLKIERVNELTGVGLPDGDYQTLAGFLLTRFGRVPRPHERLVFGEHQFEVQAASRRRIVSVRLRVGRGRGAGSRSGS